MIKISLLHPSYNRATMAFSTCCNWINNTKYPLDIEYLVGLDNTDPDKAMYETKFKEIENKVSKLIVDVGDSTCAVQAVNRLATKVSNTSELLVEICDDVDCFQDWDVALLKLLEGVNNFEDPKMIGTHDGLRDYGVVFTQPIMNRAAYSKLGFIVYPEYTSMFADNDFTEVARRTGWLVNAPHIMFKHKHYSIGLNSIDNTYSRRNNQQEFDSNHRVYQERNRRNFDL